MKALFLLPVIDEATTAGFMATVNPAYHKDFHIVDNSESGFAKKYEVGFYSPRPKNIGVGRAWNLGVKTVLEHGYDYLVILSATMRFGKQMDDFVSALENNVCPWGLETQHGWHCIALSRKVFEKIGKFDENFYPAYYEDSDFIRRMELAGIHNPMSQTQRIPKVEIVAGFEGNAHGMRKAKVHVNMEACRQYFIDKWGYEPRYDSQRHRDLLYKWPFNDPSHGLDYYPFHTIEELKVLFQLNLYKVTKNGNVVHEGRDKDAAIGVYDNIELSYKESKTIMENGTLIGFKNVFEEEVDVEMVI